VDVTEDVGCAYDVQKERPGWIAYCKCISESGVMGLCH